MSQEITPNIQLEIKKAKSHDIAVGFWGWVIFSNLVFILFFTLGDINKSGWFDNLSVIIWASFVLSTIVLFVLKRTWIGAGVVRGFFLNIGSWILLPLILSLALGGSMPKLGLYDVIQFSVIPFPLGVILFFAI
jgi:hypothetical protein